MEAYLVRAERIAPILDVPFYRQRYGLSDELDPFFHYLYHGGAAGFDPSPLFDSSFYLAKLGPDGLPPHTTPLEHYLECGAAAGLDPSVLFSTEFYLGQNPDVAAAGVNPLQHFVTDGAQQGRLAVGPDQMGLAAWVAGLLKRHPNNPYARHLNSGLKQQERASRVAPLIDIGFYHERHGLGAGIDHARHYVDEGGAAGLDPSPLFDTAFYLAQLGPEALPLGMTPLEHYLDKGALAGLDPSRLFETRSYLVNNPDVAAAEVNPLLHFVLHGAQEGRSPIPPATMSLHEWAQRLIERHPSNGYGHYLIREFSFQARAARISELVDDRFYRDRHSLPGGIDPVRHYLEEGGATALDPSPLFDARFYLAQIGPEKIGEGSTPLEHYLDEGASAGLDPSPLFSSIYYLRENPDVATAGLNPLLHFVQSGGQQGRWTVPPDRSGLDSHVERTLFWVPTSGQALSLVTNLRLKQGRFDEVVAALDAAGGSRPPPHVIWLLYVEAERREVAGFYEGAISLHHEILRLAPDFVTSRLALGLMLRFMGRIEEAEIEIAACVASGMDDVRLLAAHRAFEAERRQALDLMEGAKAALAEGHIEEARRFARQVQAARPALPGLKGLLDQLGGQPIAKEPRRRGSRLLLLDTSFPSPVSSFRFGEFSAYLTSIPSSDITSSVWDLAALGNNRTFLDLALAYSEQSGVDIGRIQSFHASRDLTCRLMYSVFLYNTYWYLNQLDHVRPERAVFTLYPGGGFGVNDSMSDRKLRAVCDDYRLRRIITTQNVTYRYLVENGFCEPERVLHLFGGVVPGCFDVAGLQAAQEARSTEEMMALHVCFVAQRYTTFGIEKGYDVFVDIVRRFANDKRFHFHVVGGFTPDLIDLHGARNITFHGVQPAGFFRAFYTSMDIITSPNVSGALLNGGSGSFDGFPTTSCVEAGLCGVAMFLSDPHGMNSRLNGEAIFEPGREFELVRRDPEEIGALLVSYHKDRSALRRLAGQGRQALIREFSYERQITPRIDLLQTELAYA